MGKLEGKVAFLTGAGAGIAKATAKRFVSEGARVALIEIKRELGERAEREIREAGGEALYVETDVTKDESVKRAVEATVARFGRLDVLFNCAAARSRRTCRCTRWISTCGSGRSLSTCSIRSCPAGTASRTSSRRAAEPSST
jgi:NAD(P)-dependent dehydrogenase (short-subunit alcohol dehydrogenase family)